MILIRLPDTASERKTLGHLAGRFSFTTWATGQTAVPESALASLALAGIVFTVEGTDDMVQSPKLEGAVVKINGDKATVRAKEGRPLNLKKIDGQWKVDVSEMSGPGTAQGVSLLNSMSKVAKQMTDEINARKYKTAAEAKAAMTQKMGQELFGGSGTKL